MTALIKNTKINSILKATPTWPAQNRPRRVLANPQVAYSAKYQQDNQVASMLIDLIGKASELDHSWPE